MVTRTVIVGALMATVLLWLGPFSVPNRAVVALILLLFPLGIILSVKRMRQEAPRGTRALASPDPKMTAAKSAIGVALIAAGVWALWVTNGEFGFTPG
jgi:hypothetical protein